MSEQQSPEQLGWSGADAMGPVVLGGSVAASADSSPAQAPPRSSAAAPTPTGSIRAATLGDQPSDDDTLGFTPYVDAVAAFLLNEGTQPPLTMSIEGPWGSGKTSFMRQLNGRL